MERQSTSSRVQAFLDRARKMKQDAVAPASSARLISDTKRTQGVSRGSDSLGLTGSKDHRMPSPQLQTQPQPQQSMGSAVSGRPAAVRKSQAVQGSKVAAGHRQQKPTHSTTNPRAIPSPSHKRPTQAHNKNTNTNKKLLSTLPNPKHGSLLSHTGNRTPSPIVQKSPKGYSKPRYSPNPRKQPQNKPTFTSMSQKPQSRGSSVGSNVSFEVDGNLIAAVERLLQILTKNHGQSATPKEKQLVGRVYEHLESYKQRAGGSDAEGSQSGVEEYKAKAKKLLQVVKEETLAMDKRLESLRRENDRLRSRLDGTAMPSLDEIIQLDATREVTSPACDAILAQFQGKHVTPNSAYAASIDRLAQDIFHSVQGHSDHFRDLVSVLARRLVSEQKEREKTIDQTEQMLAQQASVCAKLLQRLDGLATPGPKLTDLPRS